MREFWVQIIFVHRFIDWPSTVQLRMVEFYLILYARRAARH